MSGVRTGIQGEGCGGRLMIHSSAAILLVIYLANAVAWISGNVGAPPREPTVGGSVDHESLVGSHPEPAENGGIEWRTYTDPDRHFSFEYPSTWRVAAGSQYRMGLHVHVFLTINSAGKEDMWFADGLLHRLSNEGRTLLDWLPTGAIYVDVSYFEGGPAPLPRSLVNERQNELTTKSWSELLAEPEEERSEGGKLVQKYMSFKKWGARWTIFVLLHEPVAEEHRHMLERVLQSWSFDEYPSRDRFWAAVQAVDHLPPEAGPSNYYYGTRGQYCTKISQVGDEVLVTFLKGSIRSWQFRVTEEGEVIPTFAPMELPIVRWSLVILASVCIGLVLAFIARLSRKKPRLCWFLSVSSVSGLVASLALWATSFFWVSLWTGRSVFTVRWGLVVIFPEYPSDGIRITARGFQGLWTHWWPYPFVGKYPPCVDIPLWMTALVCLSLFVYCYCIPAYRQRKRRMHGLCSKCRYDLRGSINRCPECGEAFESPKLKADG